MWDDISGAAYFCIVYLVWKGEVAELAQNQALQYLKQLAFYSSSYLSVGLSTIGLHLGNTRWFIRNAVVSDATTASAYMDVVYNIGDAVAKLDSV